MMLFTATTIEMRVKASGEGKIQYTVNTNHNTNFEAPIQCCRKLNPSLFLWKQRQTTPHLMCVIGRLI